jgi:hypothetical protein
LRDPGGALGLRVCEITETALAGAARNPPLAG